MTKLHELARLGQSIWYDNIRRDLLDNGEFQGLVDAGVLGVTSNPTIFEKAIAQSGYYDSAIQKLAAEGRSTGEIYEALAMEDIGRAADMLRPVYDATNGVDGYVSLEVSPLLARETKQTIAEARRLFKSLARPNIMIKVPGTREGIPAVEQLIADGLNINVTLIFSLDCYVQVTEAYIAGLKQLEAHGGDVGRTASVASFFVSRVDSKLDPKLAAKGNMDLQGKIAIANSKIVYERFKKIFSGPRWAALAAKGARVQRPLWASTSTKNPAYRDVLYVESLIGPDTVNTMPPETLDAFLYHGEARHALEADVDIAQRDLEALAALGVDLQAVTRALETEGVDAFRDSWDKLVASLKQKCFAVAKAYAG
jgi:transaldolase